MLLSSPRRGPLARAGARLLPRQQHPRARASSASRVTSSAAAASQEVWPQQALSGRRRRKG
eukprot:5679408-Alexandrium_andersonii.AAC.1